MSVEKQLLLIWIFDSKEVGDKRESAIAVLKYREAEVMKVGILLSDSFDAFFQYLLLFCGEGDFATLGRTYFSSLISLSCRLIIN